MPWTLNKNGKTPSTHLNTSEQDTLNQFMNRIRLYGEHPKTVADSIGDTDYKQLHANQYQIRLSRSNRVTFNVDDFNQTVTILQVGGHT